jgi:hypothetical protein
MSTSHANATISDRVRLPFAFDPAALRADLAVAVRAAGGWTDHLVRQNYAGDWSVIALRHAAGATHPVMKIYADPNACAFEDSPLLGRTPAFRAVLAALRCPLQSVRLMRLTPGSIIKPHRDLDLAPEYGMARLHVPITTNPQVEFLVNAVPVAMAPGELWYLRLADPHAVANRGATDRVHLVIDCVVDDWLTGVLEADRGAEPDAART